MPTLTLEISDELDAALEALSHRRREPKIALARTLLESGLVHEARAEDAAARWLATWRGRLRGKETPAVGDERAAHLLRKHLR